jgi:hypothetical protein
MEFNWAYLWSALVVNFLLVYLVPRLITKPTGIQVVDDMVLFLNSQKGFLSHYWVDSQAVSDTPSSPTKY